jgi:1-acyl-sn-glycerol-3-phosphate acyltransferase
MRVSKMATPSAILLAPMTFVCRMTDLAAMGNSAAREWNYATPAICGMGNAQKPPSAGKETALHYLRSILFCAMVVILTVVLSLTVPFMALFNASSPTVRAVSQVWARGIMWLFRFVLGLDYREIGRANVPDGPCIIACNHQSLWETAALSMIFPDASIVAKKELGRAPIVGWFLRRYPMILVDRAAGRQALKLMVEEAQRAVAEGRKVLLFPQGTRQAIGEPLVFQAAGISALYTSLDVPVVPAACNSGLFWGKKTLMIHSGTVTLSYLPPIAPGLNRKEFQPMLERMITKESERLAGEAGARDLR